MLDQCRRLSEIATARNINGLDIQHASICPARCWFNRKRIHFQHASEHIALGSALHDGSHTRDRSINGLMGLRPDRVDWDAAIIFEHKKSSSEIGAAANQGLFYAALLSAATQREWSLSLYIYQKNRDERFNLTPEKIDDLFRLVDVIINLDASSYPPEPARIPTCRGCSHSVICWED